MVIFGRVSRHVVDIAGGGVRVALPVPAGAHVPRRGGLLRVRGHAGAAAALTRPPRARLTRATLQRHARAQAATRASLAEVDARRCRSRRRPSAHSSQNC